MSLKKSGILSMALGALAALALPATGLAGGGMHGGEGKAQGEKPQVEVETGVRGLPVPPEGNAIDEGEVGNYTAAFEEAKEYVANTGDVLVAYTTPKTDVEVARYYLRALDQEGFKLESIEVTFGDDPSKAEDRLHEIYVSKGGEQSEVVIFTTPEGKTVVRLENVSEDEAAE
ncbi:hypothetical protein L6R50_20785 [Myxococcota bacterium]|nr:hypothetical protein [Myxococcota bacterium]